MPNLIRFTPRHDMRRLQNEMDRLFEGLFPTRNGHTAFDGTVWSPRTDLAETEEGYSIHLDLPGLKKDDVEISFHDGTLTITGERQREEAEDDRTFVRVERSYGRFRRAFSLPQAANVDGIEATFEDGVLTINVPKAEEVKPRRISIN